MTCISLDRIVKTEEGCARPWVVGVATAFTVGALTIGGLLAYKHFTSDNNDSPPQITPTPTQTVEPTNKPTPIVTITPNPGTPTVSPEPTVTPTETPTPTSNPWVTPKPIQYDFEYSLKIIAFHDKAIDSLIRGKDWFLDGVSDEEALFINGITSPVQRKRVMPDADKGIEYAEGVVDMFPDSYLLDEILLNNGAIPLAILSQNTELLPKAAEITKAVMHSIENFLEIDYNSDVLVVNLGDYGISRASLDGDNIMTSETDYPGIYVRELTHTLGVGGPGWLKEGITWFMDGYALEQIKTEPWFADVYLDSSLSNAYNQGKNLSEYSYEFAMEHAENLGILDIPLVELDSMIKSNQVDPIANYLSGEVYITRIFYSLGQEGVSAMCNAARRNKNIDEAGIEAVCLEVAEKQGKTAEVKEFFDTYVFGN